MKFTYACLILLTYVCFSRGDPLLPLQSVECDEKGTLTFTLPTSSSWKIKGNATCGDDRKIQITKTTDEHSIVGCVMGTGVTFTLNQHSTDSTPNHLYITPEDQTMSVTLRCNAIKSDTTIDAHFARFTVSATHSVQAINKTTIEVITMVMELRAKTGSQGVTSISLNKTYTLLIAGAGNHNTEVTECTAASSSNATGVKIYNHSSPSGTPAVLTLFTESTDQATSIGNKKVNQIATLTGFRLVGSATVYVKCKIKVFASTITTARKRKRIGGKQQPKVHYATLKLSVRDNVLDTPVNGAVDTFPVASSLWRFILMTILLRFIY